MIQCTKSNCLFRRKTNIFTFPTFILTFKKLLQIEIKICNTFVVNGQAYLWIKHRYLISIRIAVFTFPQISKVIFGQEHTELRKIAQKYLKLFYVLLLRDYYYIALTIFKKKSILKIQMIF
jgi:hypothetical protein